ncbi:MAG: FAD-dependent oxidoreductase [Verrucomicrobiaceae bacterium]|nr:FAD-dependent oxidoreductase [Verrucomicrobiaceae bacterium]
MNSDAQKPHVAVLGGGPCGLYAARVLSRAGIAVTVLDKGDRPGGLATSHKRGENWYDLGCHMLHEFDKEIYEDMMSIMGSDSIPVQLDARIRWAGAFYRYPLQFQDMIRGIPIATLIYYTMGLFAAQFRNMLAPWIPKNAEQALIMLYGRPLYEFFFKDFTHRYWGIHPSELSATFITTKMPRLSAVDVIKRALGKVGVKDRGVKAVESALLDETLHYSRTGAEAMPRHIARVVNDSGGKVILGAEVTRILLDDSGTRVRGVCYRKDGTDHEIACDECISTIPVPHLATRCEPLPPDAVLEAARQIRYKPIAIYGLLVKKQRCIDALYIYYRDRAFHRVGEPKNAGLTVNPPDHTVLIVETTCEIGDDKWKGTDEVKQRIFSDLEHENICRREDIVEVNILHSETGYPIFALGFEPHLDKVKRWISSITNLQSVGRQGGFTYPNMHSAMRMGACAAEAAMARLNKKGASPAS